MSYIPGYIDFVEIIDGKEYNAHYKWDKTKSWLTVDYAGNSVGCAVCSFSMINSMARILLIDLLQKKKVDLNL